MRQRRECCGGSVVSCIIALPLLLVFLFAVVDVGRTVYLHMALADAAYAASRVVVESSADLSSTTLRDAACVAAPALAASDLRLSIEVVREDAQEERYKRRIYNAATAAFEERLECVTKQQIKVRLTLEGCYLTPLGRGFSVAEGAEDAEFLYKAESSGIADSTVGGGLR